MPSLGRERMTVVERLSLDTDTLSTQSSALTHDSLSAVHEEERQRPDVVSDVASHNSHFPASSLSSPDLQLPLLEVDFQQLDHSKWREVAIGLLLSRSVFKGAGR